MKKHSFNVIISTANTLSLNYLKAFFCSFFIPIDYTRTREIPAMLDLCGILDRKAECLKILDISSPQILSLSLGCSSNLWDITYVNPFETELWVLQQKASVLGLNKMQIVKGDITRIDTLSQLGTFDYIFSCSVFEHIHPENGGDIIASVNIPQLLKPGGVFIFSVPYYKEKFNEYTDGAVYGIKRESSGKTFFQRFYDEESLHKQIIIPTGLRVVGKQYIGEKYYSENNINKRMAFGVGYGKIALILGRFFNKISGIFMEESRDYKKLRKPYLAIYSLVKD